VSTGEYCALPCLLRFASATPGTDTFLRHSTQTNPNGAEAQQVRSILKSAERNPRSAPLDLLAVEPVVLKRRVECAQIGCYDQSVTCCEVCGFLCRKCDSFFHRSGSRVASFHQDHHRRPVQIEPPAAARSQSVDLSPAMLSRMPAVPTPHSGGAQRSAQRVDSSSRRSTKTAGSGHSSPAGGARSRVGTASSQASSVRGGAVVAEPSHVSEARRRLSRIDSAPTPKAL